MRDRNAATFVSGIRMCVAVGLLGLGSSVVAETPLPNFASEIRPLLSDHCFACHGPDEQERQAGVRLDTADGIAEVVDADAWEESLIVERLRTDDPDLIMPPPGHHKPLDKQSKRLLEAWIAGGAKFEDHWSFIPPKRIETPDRTIDEWLDLKLSERGLTPNGPADRTTLARRVAFDLTGLPPTWDQVQGLVNDPSPLAYETYVDRLLQSPAFGEHMGRYWLDLVRYGDTHGLHLDNYREMWHYRDWVINAFNSNKPFDVFITEQLAGDLLPEPTVDQQVASGFNRLNVTTSEGGSIYDEVFARNVIDRTDAFGTIFLGLTTGCAVCHDHKFDPITQKDYYSLSAFFNSLDGSALDGNKKDHPPVIKIPSQEQTERLDEVERELAHLDEQLKGPLDEVDAAQLAWQRSLTDRSEIVKAELVPSAASSEAGTTVTVVERSIVLDQPKATDHVEIVLPIPPGTWRTFHLEALTDEKHPRVGLSSNGNVVLSEITLDYRDNGRADTGWQQIKIATGHANIQQDDNGYAIEKAFDGVIDLDTGWAVAGHDKTGPRSAQFELTDPLEVTASADNPDAGPELRVRMSYQSRYAQHMFRAVEFQLLESAIQESVTPSIRLGDVHVIGPIERQDSNAGYADVVAGENLDAFDADAAITSGDRTYRWQHRADVLPVLTNFVPKSSDHDSATVLHQTIESEKEQTIEMTIGNDGGHVVFLNGAKIDEQRGPAKFQPLRKTVSLKLKKGTNHLFIRSVSQPGQDQGRLAFAFPSSEVEIPKRLAKRLDALASVPADQQDSHQIKALRSFYRSSYCSHPQWLALQDMRSGLLKMKDEVQKQIPTTLVWKETAQPRDAFVLQRGQYDSPGEKVERRTPEFLPPMPKDAPSDRLGLAQWLVHENHPLTARVAVNRFWQQVFGIGLVKTSEDFGNQGNPPSHPELLDQLAIEFQESGWNVKAFMKRLVMTQAYQRGAKTSLTLLAVDPTNRLLARGPRFRLDAEMLRDQTLAISGLLVDQQGGPSVKPPQPAGLWAAVGYTDSDTAVFVADEGDRIYRRSVYTFWKRTSAPAVMTTFDAPSRESCTARRERTNTPLQALLLLNEPQTLKASQELAKQALSWNDLSVSGEMDVPSARLVRLFHHVVLRTPEPEEVKTLSRLATDLGHYYANDLDQAQSLVGISDAELAAWTVLSNTLLNLDEVVCK
ncbi:PSD1 and planctomycete cytochrome C domain-containing protein [Neorhodopirellula pilleata]|nr:PSD1 and planctomycete cytochrome C domain-containing protein [Neorhodopirellula pilleata]